MRLSLAAQLTSLNAKSSKYSPVSLKPENTFLYPGGAPRGPQTIVILGRLPGASTARSRETASTSLDGREYPTTTTSRALSSDLLASPQIGPMWRPSPALPRIGGTIAASRNFPPHHGQLFRRIGTYGLSNAVTLSMYFPDSGQPRHTPQFAEPCNLRRDNSDPERRRPRLRWLLSNSIIPAD